MSHAHDALSDVLQNTFGWGKDDAHLPKPDPRTLSALSMDEEVIRGGRPLNLIHMVRGSMHKPKDYNFYWDRAIKDWLWRLDRGKIG